MFINIDFAYLETTIGVKLNYEPNRRRFRVVFRPMRSIFIWVNNVGRPAIGWRIFPVHYASPCRVNVRSVRTDYEETGNFKKRDSAVEPEQAQWLEFEGQG